MLEIVHLIYGSRSKRYSKVGEKNKTPKNKSFQFLGGIPIHLKWSYTQCSIETKQRRHQHLLQWWNKEDWLCPCLSRWRWIWWQAARNSDCRGWSISQWCECCSSGFQVRICQNPSPVSPKSSKFLTKSSSALVLVKTLADDRHWCFMCLWQVLCYQYWHFSTNTKQ